MPLSSMKKAFISISFKKKNELEGEITAITEVLKKHDMNPFVFVNTQLRVYRFFLL